MGTGRQAARRERVTQRARARTHTHTNTQTHTDVQVHRPHACLPARTRRVPAPPPRGETRRRKTKVWMQCGGGMRTLLLESAPSRAPRLELAPHPRHGHGETQHSARCSTRTQAPRRRLSQSVRATAAPSQAPRLSHAQHPQHRVCEVYRAVRRAQQHAHAASPHAVTTRRRRRGPGDDVPAEGAVVAQEGGDAAAVAELHQHAQPPLPPLRLPVSAVQS